MDIISSAVMPEGTGGRLVAVIMNNLGKGVVTGYFAEGGFLGVEIKLDERYRPAWDIKQNGYGERKTARLFGVDIDHVEKHFRYAFSLAGKVYRARNVNDRTALIKALGKDPALAVYHPVHVQD